MGQLQSIHGKLTEMGYQVVAVSADRPEKVREILAKKKLDYRLLSDNDMRAAQAMGIAYKVDDATLEGLKRFGIDIEAASGRTHHILPVPSVFVLDAEGRIRFEYVNPDYRERIHPDVLETAARTALP